MELEEVLERNFTKITDEYREFAIKKSKCQACPIYKHYKQVGQSEGNASNPTFMFIGEALGKDEVEHVRPFVGLAGKRLRAELRKHTAFRRENCLISNVLACRPKDNKFPSSDHSVEVQTCTRKWLFPEIKMVRPKIIVTLGNPALKWVQGDWGVTANRGKWKFLHQLRAWGFATYHPSYVIRSENTGKKFVVEQFEADIATLATSWQTMVGDYRLTMNEQDWKRKKALNTVIDLGLAGK